ncbi:MAG: hypothetical protein N2170_09040, partial [Bacteroidia bacterium]|nr:hypothetical protein [Bacteroidia bacterium]
IGGSAWGMDKASQRDWLAAHGFAVPAYRVIRKSLLWESPEELVEEIAQTIGFPCVVKHPLQGSTIGVRVCESPERFLEVAFRCAFLWPVRWLPSEPTGALVDLVHGIGLPLLYRDAAGVARQLLTDWDELAYFLAHRPHQGFVEAWDSPENLLVEAFIPGEEFSVIVIETPTGEKVALPPTHIRKGERIYDYRAKYLSGTTSKVTPAQSLPNREIQRAAERLASSANLQVCARLDGIVDQEGRIYFNDPNTTSGLLPASLLFHQAAEVGFTPKDFLTYLIDTSLRQVRTGPMRGFLRRHRLAFHLSSREKAPSRGRIAVIFGGISTERHISLESGRNVVEKLSSQYEVLPLFLWVREGRLELWELPPRLLFKDNADDVAAALGKHAIPTVTQETRARIASLRRVYPLIDAYEARFLTWDELKDRVDFVFLALHGRPGEDGTVQKLVEEIGLPYNGSPPSVCALAMDKEATHRYLEQKGFRVPPHYRVLRRAWEAHPAECIREIEEKLGSYPLVGKPVDEGCSSGVRLLPDREALYRYLSGIFRKDPFLSPEMREALGLMPDEPFPAKEEALIEQYLRGPEWLEVTVGVITHTERERIRYQAFLPSETVKGGDFLRLEEKFLAGAGQNVTPARLYPQDPERNERALQWIQRSVEAIAEAVGVHGYARIDGFVRLLEEGDPEFWTLEINALPGLTPATVFFHQAALAGYTPFSILEHIIEEGRRRRELA